MKIAGIIGGLGPESTVDYYQALLRTWRERRPDGSAPAIVITSIDLQRMVGLVTAGRLADMTEYLLGECRRLAAAGADFGLISANTPHVVFDDLAPRSPLPLISIVETTRDAARARGLRRLALLGTRFTMQGRFYPGAFERAGMVIVTPRPDEQAFIHDTYMGELVNGVFRDEARQRFHAIVRRLRADELVDGVILGGTELPLLLRDPVEAGIPLLDTTRLHVERAVEEMLT